MTEHNADHKDKADSFPSQARPGFWRHGVGIGYCEAYYAKSWWHRGGEEYCRSGV